MTWFLLVAALWSPPERAVVTAQTHVQAALEGVELTPAKVHVRRTRTVVRFAQTWRGLPVLDRAVTVTVRDGRVIRTHGQATPIRHFRAATIDAERARTLAMSARNGAVGEPRAVVLALGDVGTAAFEVDVVAASFSHVVVRIDAHEGRVVGVQNKVWH